MKVNINLLRRCSWLRSVEFCWSYKELEGHIICIIKVKGVVTVACITPVPHSFSLQSVIIVGASKARVIKQATFCDVNRKSTFISISAFKIQNTQEQLPRKELPSAIQSISTRLFIIFHHLSWSLGWVGRVVQKRDLTSKSDSHLYPIKLFKFHYSFPPFLFEIEIQVIDCSLA